jgi:hypothetical protein
MEKLLKYRICKISQIVFTMDSQDLLQMKSAREIS